MKEPLLLNWLFYDTPPPFPSLFSLDSARITKTEDDAFSRLLLFKSLIQSCQLPFLTGRAEDSAPPEFSLSDFSSFAISELG